MKRFWEKVDRRGPDDCWEWTASTLAGGYGQFYMSPDRPTTYAHRVSWEIHNGAIPDGKYVCHHCDNRLCVNPNHLFIGTHLENMQDAARKGRMIKEPMTGESNGRAKLKASDIPQIRRLVKSHTQAKVAAMYGVSHQLISRIARKRCWKHLHEDI